MENPSSKSTPWKRHSENLDTPLARLRQKPRNIICTTSNIPFGICAGVRTTSEEKKVTVINHNSEVVTNEVNDDLNSGSANNWIPTHIRKKAQLTYSIEEHVLNILKQQGLRRQL
ncbi:hypothetical protein KIN20_011103 [Parelaphostrongylus tenuis]|uniref:Uncharacterized protein n=1 Tax=Parelaphostrongylus tenuis TaxID=148309 RepID=A0AAD5MUY1_PARTN|nr:hypothetical protein KIN20_011103 [Parelaphostrongylus tenuis]